MNKEQLMRNFIQSVIHEKKIGLIASNEWALYSGFKYFVMAYDKQDFKMKTSTSFKQFCISINPIITPISELTLSILHEIGHYQNRQKHTRQIQTYNAMVAACQTDEEYYSLPEELEATQWAINFILTYPQMIEQFEKQIWPETTPNNQL